MQGEGQFDPTDLDAVSQSEKDRIEQQRVEAATATNDLRWLMSGPRGRRIMFRILSDAGLDESSYSPNAMEMARQEGRKELARGLRRLLDRICPDLYVQMCKEHKRERTNSDDRSQHQR